MSNDDTNADDNLEAVDSFDDLNADSDDIQQVDSFSDLDSQSSDGELDYVPTDSFDALDDEADSPSQVDDTTSNASPAEQLATPADDATASDGGATIGEALSDSPTAPVQDADADLLPEDDSELHDFDFGDDEPVAVETKQPAIDEVDTDNAVPNEAAAESESAAVSSEIPEVPACTRLVISPSPSSVMAGEQVAFSVEAFDNDGGVVEKPDVRWTAKGGTIDKEGVYTAAWNFSSKASAGLAIGIGGVLLGWSGYDAEVEQQSESVRNTILFIAGGLPAAGYALGTLLFSRFSLGEAAHAEVLAQLRERRAAEEQLTD